MKTKISKSILSAIAVAKADWLLLTVFTVFAVLFYTCKKDEFVSPNKTNDGYNVIVLPDNALNKIVNYSDGAITFSEAVNCSKNDILVAKISPETPYGFLRRVNSLSDNKKIVYTHQASLEEAVEEGTLEFTKTLLPSDKSSFKSLEGVTLTEGKAFNFSYQLENVVLYDADGNTSTTDDQVIANGYIDFNSSFDFKLKTKNWKIDYFHFKNTINENSKLEINANTSEFALDEKTTIFQTWFTPFVVMAGPVPVVFVPELEVNVGLDGNVSINSSMNVTQEASLTGGIKYENSQWGIINDFSNDFLFNAPQIPSELNVKASAGPQLGLFLYGIAGPYIEANAFARLNASGSPNLSWKLYGGFEAKAGTKVEVLGKELLDYNATLIAESTILSQFNALETSTITDPRDGKVYNTVKIGEQWWMSENLNYDTINSFCYDNNTTNCDIYGRLYDWETACASCPGGWHLPSDGEWDILANYLGGSDVAGGKMKETGYAHWNFPNTGATNESGFSGLPGGIKSPVDGLFYYLSSSNHFWSSTEAYWEPSTRADIYSLYFNSDTLKPGDGIKSGTGISIRCIKD